MEFQAKAGTHLADPDPPTFRDTWQGCVLTVVTVIYIYTLNSSGMT